MKRNIIFLLILSLCGCFGVKAQTTGDEMNPEETPERFTLYYSAESLLNIYKYLIADTTTVSNYEARQGGMGGAFYSDIPSLGPMWDYSDMPLNAGAGPTMSLSGGGWDIDNPHFPKILRREFRRGNREYRRKYRKQIPDERRRLVLYLHALSAEEERPLVFTDIWRDYGGDIERYVDDIYDRSILINHKRMTNFCNYPRVKTFVSDPGVRFVISMELYRNAQKLKALQATVDSVK